MSQKHLTTGVLIGVLIWTPGYAAQTCDTSASETMESARDKMAADGQTIFTRYMPQPEDLGVQACLDGILGSFSVGFDFLDPRELARRAAQQACTFVRGKVNDAMGGLSQSIELPGGIGGVRTGQGARGSAGTVIVEPGSPGTSPTIRTEGDFGGLGGVQRDFLQ